MPFMNVFFRQVHGLPDPVIGTLFAWGSLSMGIGLLIAPPLADRFGKIQLVVITQALSIPFLILLGFSPWLWLATAAYYIRVALMNMSGPGLPDLCHGACRSILPRHRSQPGQHGLEFWLGLQPHRQRLAPGALWFWGGFCRHHCTVYHLHWPLLVVFLAEKNHRQSANYSSS